MSPEPTSLARDPDVPPVNTSTGSIYPPPPDTDVERRTGWISLGGGTRLSLEQPAGDEALEQFRTTDDPGALFRAALTLLSRRPANVDELSPREQATVAASALDWVGYETHLADDGTELADLLDEVLERWERHPAADVSGADAPAPADD